MPKCLRPTSSIWSCRFATGSIAALKFVLLGTVVAAASAQEDSADVADALETSDAPAGFTGKPRWEVGVGGGYLESFDYPGSSDPNRRSIALPFAIYRGPVLRLGDGGWCARWRSSGRGCS